MSRWLKSVNSLLEQLDGQVETAIEEQAVARVAGVEEEHHARQGRDVVESILVRRGLSMAVEKEDDSVVSDKGVVPPIVDRNKGNESQSGTMAHGEGAKDEAEAAVLVDATDFNDDNDVNGEGSFVDEVSLPRTDEKSELGAHGSVVREPSRVDEAAKQSVANDDDAKSASTQSDTLDETAAEKSQVDKTETSLVDISMEASTSEVLNVESPEVPPAPLANSNNSFEKEYKLALAELRESQKEARTLRRHVVSLNEELETAEAEIQAQRTELERAGERMEKDRARHKEEKEHLTTRHAEELKALKVQHEYTISEHKARFDLQLEDARKRMREVEERRMQEGGDWTKELEVAVQREQETSMRLAMLEDEKSTLLSQVSSLQSQQAALENRLESISQTADNAMEREREAEDRLDAALSMHVRQLNQRQSRESELERMVGDLGAALVVARNKEINRLKADQNGSVAVTFGSQDLSEMKARLEAADDELETMKAQLSLERQRSQTLHQELREMSQERTEEASAAHARQLQNDRRIADMSVTISRLQSSLREIQRDSLSDSQDFGLGSDEEEMKRQVKALSDQVMRQQEKIGRCTSEVSALKSRLQVALNRAEVAEEALSSSTSGDHLYDIESAPSSGNMLDGRRTVRRRGGKRGKGTDSFGGSIRSAIRLNPGQGQNVEKIGKAIDVVDSFSVETGKYLRYNPLARGAFLLYLLLVHFWTFALLVFHAHSYETVHGDFGAGKQMAHGPHALMQQLDPSQGIAIEQRRNPPLNP